MLLHCGFLIFGQIQIMSEPASKNQSIKSWAEDDRPREKLLSKGRGALSDAELIAILIGSGTPKVSAVDLAKEILNSVHNNLNELARLSVTDLMRFKGIGEAKAISIVTALEMGKRRRMAEVLERKKIASSSDVFDLMQPLLGDIGHEEFHIVYLSNSNKVMRTQAISRGGITGTVADIRLIMKAALDVGATSIILCHNHPSGNKKPSQADISLTRKVKQAGEIMDVKVLDHIIITLKEYYSFADEGML
jgi:DNA repair protein RadC